MKNILIVLAIFLMVSCKDEFIKLNPISTTNINALFITDKDYNDALIGVYSMLQIQGPNIWQFGDLPGDDCEQQFLTSIGQVNIDFFSVNSNDALFLSTWKNYYKLISRANMVLSKCETADVSIIKNKDLYEGEAKFLRALAYFDLVRIFGDVPLVTIPTNAEEASKSARASADKIYETIIKDLLDSEILLPSNYTGKNIGKATKGAAKALLGKVYLTQHDFVKAENKLNEVTAMGYSLLNNFNDLFNYQKDEHHSEYIFDIEYAEGFGGLGSPFSNAFTPLNNALMLFYGITGGGGGSNSGTPSDELFTLFESKDKRKDITVARGYTNNEGTYIPIPTFDIRSFTKKYITRTSRASDSNANWKLIRYADVLLMYAEALNENGKSTQSLENLNKVRTRAGLDPLINLTQSEIREKIYLERRLELYLEGSRWFDLVRTGRALSVMQYKGMKSYMTIFPIPLSQIQVINDSAILKQNDGY